jgi:hypothetical protein
MSDESDKALADFFAKGGIVQQIPFRASGRVEGAVPNKVWGAKKAGRPSSADVETPTEIDEDEE